MYKEDLALNSQLRFISHKTQPNQIIYIYIYIYIYAVYPKSEYTPHISADI